MKLLKDSRGQATVLTVVSLVVLCGMVTLVLDVGSWYRADRALQSEADAAALAGAQALPDSTAEATALAIQYANKNGGGLDASGVSFASKLAANDTIKVELSKPAPGFFSKVLGVDSVTVAAHAGARAAPTGQALYVAPIVVNVNHPMLTTCNPNPCVDPTEIELADLHKPGSGNASGSFGLINLRKEDGNGNVGASTLGDWIVHGFNQYLKVDQDYWAVPSADWNSNAVRDGMDIRTGTILIFPIYDKIVGSGSNAKYHIVSWVGFYVTDFVSTGSGGKVYGHFVRPFVAKGIQASSLNQIPYYGVKTVQLID